MVEITHFSLPCCALALGELLHYLTEASLVLPSQLLSTKF